MNVAHQRWWQIFEVVFGVPFLLAIALQLAVPFWLPYGALAPVIIVAGVGLIILGVGLVILARRELRKHSQPTDPGLPTSQIVTTGVFSISRNPLYLGGVCTLVGIALALNLAWAFVFLPLALIACHYILIVPEEKYLEAEFGEEYRRYAASVRRWIGRSRRIHREGGPP